jgi:phenylalanyl-tRNA synthetase beta chain
MKHFSKKYIQEFIEGELPADAILADNLSKKAFEIEEIQMLPDGDSLYEVKVLPNRIASALNVYGMAGEMAAVCDLKLKDINEAFKLSGIVDVLTDASIEKRNDYLNLHKIGEGKDVDVKRMTVMCVTVASVDSMRETPMYIKELLEKSGSRSINNLVDMTNYVLTTMGQPTHVFDADKVIGRLAVRYATDGESLELLDGKIVKLTSHDLVIADDVRALSLAGVKGGKPAEIDVNTKRVIFEIGVFNPDMIRKTTQRHGIRTDASKIYENNLTTSKAADVLRVFKKLLVDDCGDKMSIEFVADIINLEDIAQSVNIKLADINSIGGINLKLEEVLVILEKLNFKVTINGDVLEVLPPKDRLDLKIKQDIAEEVIRIYGLDNIVSIEPVIKNKYKYDTYFLVENKIRKILLVKGYSDIFTYTFRDRGEIKVLKAVAEDKNFLRDNLTLSAMETYEKNKNYTAIYEEELLKFFEIGSVFKSAGEERRCVLVCEDGKKKSKYLSDLENTLRDILNSFDMQSVDTESVIKNKNEKLASLEFDIDLIVEYVEKNEIQINFEETNTFTEIKNINYKNYSLYPFITRDVSMWIPSAVKFEEIKLNLENLNLNNFLKVYKFDEFTPTDENNVNHGKTSIAFRIIFQSHDKTLTDVEVEQEMISINKYLADRGFEVR